MGPAIARALAPLPLWALVLTAGCSGAGRYGHSRVYQPTSDESHATAAAKEYDPVMSARFPDQWRQQLVSLFGVVTQRQTSAPGSVYVEVSLRTLEPRNLCETAEEDSCRVTVSEREGGKIHVRLPTVAPEDELGERSIGGGSLLRVVGTISPERDPQDGSAIVQASWYRHWPHHFYVTTRSAAVMHR